MLQRLKAVYGCADATLQLSAPAYKCRSRRTIVIGIKMVILLAQLHLRLKYVFADSHLFVEHAHYFGISLREFLLDLGTIQNTAHNAYELRVIEKLTKFGYFRVG